MIKRKNLVALLEAVPAFKTPDYELEQYKTGADLAASIAFAIENSFGDINNHIVADLGCGTGILSAACAALGAAYIVAVDIDPSALEQAAAALDEMGLIDNVDFINADVSTLYQYGFLRGQSPRSLPRENSSSASVMKEELVSASRRLVDDSVSNSHPLIHSNGIFETVLMNPPFGTRRQGIDVAFLRSALSLCTKNGVVYSLHKSSTREHLAHLAEAWGVGFDLVAELKFDIPATYAFHKADSLNVDVDLLRFTKGSRGADVSEREKGKRSKKVTLK
jgi:predicted RNA methylase